MRTLAPRHTGATREGTLTGEEGDDVVSKGE